MLVSHTKRFIYTKTIKTGGTSVEVYFEPYCFRPGEYEFTRQRFQYESEAGIVGFRGIKRENDGNYWYNHAPAAEIKAKVGDEIWNSYFKFCCIRDPFDKLVSAFHFFALPKEQCASMSFPEIKDRFREWMGKRQFFDDWNIFTIDDQVCVDRVIRYERLLEDLEEVCAHLGIPWEPERLMRLKSEFNPRVRPFAEYFDADTSRLAAEAYSHHLEQFGYRPPV
jgi:sulfotransferase famil protein